MFNFEAADVERDKVKIILTENDDGDEITITLHEHQAFNLAMAILSKVSYAAKKKRK